MRVFILTMLLAAGALWAQEPPPVPPEEERAKQQALQLEQLRREVEELRLRLSYAEAQASQNEQLLLQVEQLNAQLAALRTQEAEARAQAAERAAAVDLAIGNLVLLEQQLISGDTTNADAVLANASSVLPSIAQVSVEAARHAIANKDLANARVYLLWAAHEAQKSLTSP